MDLALQLVGASGRRILRPVSILVVMDLALQPFSLRDTRETVCRFQSLL